MKYNKSTIKKITDALAEGQGRVRACKLANITYETFTVWMRTKPEFSEAVEKAEEIGYAKVRDICERKIIENEQWQAAAWWLERLYPEKYGKREIIKHSIEGGILPDEVKVKLDDDDDDGSDDSQAKQEVH